ncbi:MAG: AmmeMemoRadiSam system protein B, partial [Fidelibacterota bacterium]
MITRPPSVAGTFYPGDKKELLADIQSYLDEAGDSGAGDAAGIVVPHAGYVYSGLTAAHAYRILTDHAYEKVTVLAPSHFETFEGLSVYSGDALATPLGEVEVSVEDRDRLVNYEGVVASELGYRQEHSLEVQLPFLQHAVKPGWKIIP